jgi:hypothetical protein
MAYFKASRFIDSRISAYPKYTDYYVRRTGIAPSVLRVDQDKQRFKTAEEFELYASKIYTNFGQVLGSKRTQIGLAAATIGYNRKTFLCLRRLPSSKNLINHQENIWNLKSNY